MAREKGLVDDYCEIIELINKKNAYLDEMAKNHYDGGHSFEEIYEDDIKELVRLKNNFAVLFARLSSGPPN